MAKRIYVADDEKNICFLIQNFLEKEGFEVECFEDGESLLAACQKSMPDLCILDIMMPGMDGYQAYKEIRKIRDIPALMLSAKDQEYDKLQGFELGIDDYVVKPFSIRELMARVRVILARNRGRKEMKQGVYEFGGLKINIPAREVFVDGERLNLRPKEYDLLFFLVENQGIVFSRDTLLERVWGFDFMGDDRTVDAQIKMLRHALGDYRRFIVTYRGAGYKFEDQ